MTQINNTPTTSLPLPISTRTTDTHMPIDTIGHSTHTIDSFVELLRGAGVECVVDVRSIRRSRTNPQFNQDTLPASLAAHGIDYRVIAELGGRRGRQHTIDPVVNGYWENTSFHNYADWAMQAAFHAGLDELRELAHRRHCAIMCAESVWWRCHRRIIADHLLACGETVRHILPTRIEPATPTAGACFDADANVSYPAVSPPGLLCPGKR